MSSATDEKVDLGDLDLLDDDVEHAACLNCYPWGSVPIMGKFIAYCGKEAISRVEDTVEMPPNACRKCVELYMTTGCSRCGTSP